MQINNWEKLFSYTPMRDIMGYLLSMNMEDQTIAVDSNAYDIQSTGAKSMMINGEPMLCAADAALDISAEPPYAAWAAGASYTTQGVLSEVTKEGRHFVCILAHTASVAGKSDDEIRNEPLIGAEWETYWRELKKWAVTGNLDSVADGTTKWYLVCAMIDGTLRIFKAYDTVNAHSTVISIPAYDPTRYCPVALVAYANTTGDTNADVIGAAATCDFGTYGVFKKLTGPIIPALSKLI